MPMNDERQAATPAPAEPVATLFRHALVWGQTYGGPALTDGALDAMAAKFAEQVAAPPATPAAQPADEREAFKAWAKNRGGGTELRYFGRCYWEGWQARAALEGR